MIQLVKIKRVFKISQGLVLILLLQNQLSGIQSHASKDDQEVHSTSRRVPDIVQRIRVSDKGQKVPDASRDEPSTIRGEPSEAGLGELEPPALDTSRGEHELPLSSETRPKKSKSSFDIIIKESMLDPDQLFNPFFYSSPNFGSEEFKILGYRIPPVDFYTFFLIYGKEIDDFYAHKDYPLFFLPWMMVGYYDIVAERKRKSKLEPRGVFSSSFFKKNNSIFLYSVLTKEFIKSLSFQQIDQLLSSETSGLNKLYLRKDLTYNPDAKLNLKEDLSELDFINQTKIGVLKLALNDIRSMLIAKNNIKQLENSINEKIEKEEESLESKTLEEIQKKIVKYNQDIGKIIETIFEKNEEALSLTSPDVTSPSETPVVGTLFSQTQKDEITDELLIIKFFQSVAENLMIVDIKSLNQYMDFINEAMFEKNKKEALKEALSLTEALGLTSPDAENVMIVDIESLNQYIDFINKAIFEKNKKEALSLTSPDVTSPDEESVVETSVSSVSQTQKVRSTDLSILQLFQSVAENLMIVDTDFLRQYIGAINHVITFIHFNSKAEGLPDSEIRALILKLELDKMKILLRLNNRLIGELKKQESKGKSINNFLNHYIKKFQYNVKGIFFETIRTHETVLRLKEQPEKGSELKKIYILRKELLNKLKAKIEKVPTHQMLENWLKALKTSLQKVSDKIFGIKCENIIKH